MKKQAGIIASIAAAVLVAALGFGTSFRVPLDENGKPILEEKAAISTSYLEDHWDEIRTELKENAEDLSAILAEAGGDLNQVAGKYCTGSGNNFTVSGTGVVTEADTESRTGLLTVQPEGYDGPYTFLLQIGPVFKGNAVRDSLTCIGFSDFENQIEWSKVSGNIMAKISEEYLKSCDFSDIVGKTVAFSGCFTLAKSEKIMIAPTELEIR